MTAPFLEGPRLILRALEESDADGPYPGWLNDPIVCAGNSHAVFPYGRQAAREFIRQRAGLRDELVLAILLKAGDRHIGNIALQHVHSIYRSADLSILIGEREAWGQGYGLEACRLLCRHGFDNLNLHRIACGTFEGNLSMQKLAQALGMRQEGLRRQAAWKNGRFIDLIEYGLLREEFRSAGEEP